MPEPHTNVRHARVRRDSTQRTLHDHETRIRTLEALTMLPPTETYKLISTASDNEHVILAEPGLVFGYFLSNVVSEAPAYIKLYNKITAPVLGTDVPQLTIAIPEGSSANNEYAHGIIFDVGIGIALSVDPDDAGTGQVAAEEVIVNLFYLAG